MLGLIISLIAALIIALICGLFCHHFIKGYWPANIAATVYAVLTFQLLGYIEAGAVDPYWFISSVVVTLIALPIAMLIGTLRKERKQPPAES